MTKQNQNDKSDGAKRGTRSTPTERMLNMARAASQRLGISLPVNAEADFDACKSFLDEHAGQLPPTDKQVAYAKRVAEQSGIPMPEEALKSWRAMREWLDKNSPRS